MERFIESAHASKSRREGNFGHWQPRFMNELLGEQNSAGLRNGNGRCAKVLAKKAAELPLAYAKAISQVVDARPVQCAEFNQRQSPRHGVGCPAPRAEIGRRFRPASQTWPKARLLRCCRRRKECHVLRLRRPRRADRTAVDPGGFHASEEPAIKPGITQRNGAVA